MVNKLLTTLTGEAYQPVRVYYDVTKQKTVIGAFKKIKCMEFDPSRNRWVWLFSNEARKLRFQKKQHEIPKQQQPIVIGVFRFPSAHQMTFDVRSYDRLVEGVRFFDRRINRRAAKAIKMRLVNPMFEVANHEEAKPLFNKSFDDWFERDDIPRPKAERILDEMEDLMEQYPEGLPDEIREQAVMKMIEEFDQEPTPDVEELPINFYDDGFDALQMSLQLRQLGAWRQLQGEEASPMQIIRDALSSGQFNDLEDD